MDGAKEEAEGGKEEVAGARAEKDPADAAAAVPEGAEDGDRKGGEAGAKAADEGGEEAAPAGPTEEEVYDMTSQLLREDEALKSALLEGALSPPHHHPGPGHGRATSLFFLRRTADG